MKKLITFVLLALASAGYYYDETSDKRKAENAQTETVIDVGAQTLVGEPTDNNPIGVMFDTDMAGYACPSDLDDNQMYILSWLMGNLFKYEGMVSTNAYTTSKCNDGVETYRAMLTNHYAPMYHNNNLRAKGYPSPESYASKLYVGSRGSDETYTGFNEGAQAYIDAAHRYTPENRLNIVVGGTITTLAQAIHRDPTIKPKIKVFAVLSWNRDMDQASFDYLRDNHNDGTLEFLGDEAAHSGIRAKSSDYLASGKLETEADIALWRDSFLYQIPGYKAAWQEWRLHLSHESNDVHRIKAGDLTMLFAAIYPVFYNGNFTMRDGVNFWYDDDISYFSRHRDTLYTILENGAVNFGVDPSLRWFN